jgi:hypothetical protein
VAGVARNAGCVRPVVFKWRTRPLYGKPIAIAGDSDSRLRGRPSRLVHELLLTSQLCRPFSSWEYPVRELSISQRHRREVIHSTQSMANSTTRLWPQSIEDTIPGRT